MEGKGICFEVRRGGWQTRSTVTSSRVLYTQLYSAGDHKRKTPNESFFDGWKKVVSAKLDFNRCMSGTMVVVGI